MAQYIDKDALVAEIEKRQSIVLDPLNNNIHTKRLEETYKSILSFLNTLEVKEVEEKFDRPNIKTKDVLEVTSRMKYIDEDLKPIADFIMDYTSWNLHKDEWNQPVLEVPLFRVLDALMQRGKPYCCSN